MRRLRLAVLLAVLATVACTTDTTSSTSPDGDTPAPTTAPTPQPGDAASFLVEVEGYAYADPPAAWRELIEGIDELADAAVDSAIRTVRKGEEAIAVVWVTVVEEAKQFDDVPNEELRAEAEVDALAEYEGREVAESEVQVYGDARVVHAQPRDEGWKHIYFWPVKPSTIIRFAGDDASAVEAYIEAFVAAS